jgi:hypothetical protein
VSDHLGELAALHALGMLSDRERTEAEEHVEACEACRRLLLQAEADVTAIAASQPCYEAPRELQTRIFSEIASKGSGVATRPWLPYLAVAAGILLALLPSSYLWQENRTMHDIVASDNELMSRLASGPHRTAAFAGEGPPAKVMYALNGSWYCVVVEHASKPMGVVWSHDGTQTPLGSVVPRGEVAILFLAQSHPMGRLSLTSGGQVVSQAQLVF